MAEATSESINSLSSRLARNTFHPFLHRSVVYVGRPQFDAPPPLPLPLTSFHLLAARTWDVNTWQKRFVPPGLPVSWIMMAPSISPTTPGGPNNPGLRLYKFETTTGQVIINICASLFIERGYIYIYIFLLFLSFPFVQVLDYTQYYLNLPEANSGTANWLIEYSLLEYYNLQEITAISLHDLADRFTQFNDYAFVRYVENFPKSLTLSPRSPRCYISLAELYIIGGKETRNESLSTLYRNPCMNARWRENLDHPL